MPKYSVNVKSLLNNHYIDDRGMQHWTVQRKAWHGGEQRWFIIQPGKINALSIKRMKQFPEESYREVGFLQKWLFWLVLHRGEPIQGLTPTRLVLHQHPQMMLEQKDGKSIPFPLLQWSWKLTPSSSLPLVNGPWVFVRLLWSASANVISLRHDDPGRVCLELC